MLRMVILATAIWLGLLATASAEPRSAHEFAFTSIDGEPMPMRDFAGRAVLVVNTASLCGFTHQYGDLQSLWQDYRDRGLVVLGVPSNDFGGQEPGSAAEIKEFCEVNFDVDFPLTEKVHVKGEEAHPLFKWLGKQGGLLSKPRWNFYKYVIGRDGKLVDWFASTTKPDAPKVKKALEKALGK